MIIRLVCNNSEEFKSLRLSSASLTLWVFGYPSRKETTGIAFSPDGKHMYFAYQGDGILFDVTRTDGLTFFDYSNPPMLEDDDGWPLFDWISDFFTSSKKGDDPF